MVDFWVKRITFLFRGKHSRKPKQFARKGKVIIHNFVCHPNSSMDTAAAWKKFHFILFTDFHMIDNLLMVVPAFGRCILIWLSVDISWLGYVNWFTNFIGQPFRVYMASLPWQIIIQIYLFINLTFFLLFFRYEEQMHLAKDRAATKIINSKAKGFTVSWN